MNNIAKTLLLFIFFPASVFAANGDILYENCAGNGCTGASTSAAGVRTVETTGCFSGSCLKFDASGSGTDWGGTDVIGTGISNVDEITVVYHVKLSIYSGASGNNIKGVRAYNNSEYLYATEDGHFGYDHYLSYWSSSTFDPTDAVTGLKTSSGYCDIDNGDGTYNCNRLDLDYTVGGEAGLPANTWKSIRLWFKMPTTTSSSDGEAKMWVDDTLIYYAYDVDGSGWITTAEFTGLTFYPSSAATQDFDHWMDEMIVYEGYVPPSGATDETAPTVTATNIANQASGTTSVTPSLTATDNVDVTACKWSSNVAHASDYSSMTNTMTETTGWSADSDYTGLSDGNTYILYYGCTDAAGNYGYDNDSFEILSPTGGGAGKAPYAASGRAGYSAASSAGYVE